MNKHQVKAALRDFGLTPSRLALMNDCVNAFCVAMRGKIYGIRETGNAYLWFEHGWKEAWRNMEEKQS